MARLPSDQDLGGMPTAGYSRPIVAPDYSPLATGGAALAKGAQDLGTGLFSFAKTKTAETDALGEAKAAAAYTTGRAKLDDERDNITDPEELAAHKEKYDANLATAAGFIPDPKKQELFKLKYQTDAVRGGLAVDTRIDKLKGDEEMAGFHSSADTLIQNSPKMDEATRAENIKTLQSTIDTLKENGRITADQAQKMKRDVAEKYAVTAVNSLPAEERIAALVPDVKGNEGAKAAFDYFVKQGWTPAQAAGIVGNLLHESGGKLNPNATAAGDGADGSDSIGIGQWNSDRARALKAFAAKAGKNWNDYGVQLAFVQHELTGSESAAGDALKRAQSPSEATSAFLQFERPAGYEGGLATAHGGANRLGQARRVFSAFGDGKDTIAGSQMAELINPNTRVDILNGAAREWTQNARADLTQQRQEAATVKSLLDDDQASLVNTGKPLADLTPERVGKALGPQAQADFLRSRDNAQRYYDATNDWNTTPANEIIGRVNSLKPKGGEAGFVDQQKFYEAAQKQAQALIKQRTEDPAAAVDTHPEVQKARASLDPSKPETIAALSKARLTAQAAIGIPEGNRMPITKQEAVALAKPIMMAADGRETMDAIRAVLPFLDKAYGDKADNVLEYALTQAGVDAQVTKTAHGLLRKLHQGIAPNQTDANRLQTDQTNAAMSRAAGTPAPQWSPEALEAAQGRPQPQPDTAPAVAPAASGAAPAAAPAGTSRDAVRPSNEALDDLIHNPSHAAAFDQKYGKGMAQRVLKKYQEKTGAQ